MATTTARLSTAPRYPGLSSPSRLILVLLFSGSVAVASVTHAQDLGFRYRSGKCVNPDGERGYNPGYRGECGGLRGADLREADLTELNLSGADLHAARLTRAKLKGAILVGARVRNADLELADLREADLRDAWLDRSRLRLADLTGAKLQGARLNRTVLAGAILRGVDLSRADLRLADLRGADLSYADLTRANLRGAMGDGRTVMPSTLSAAEATRRGMVFRP